MSTPFRMTLLAGAVALALVAWVGARSGVEVELIDGQVVRGTEAERDGDSYVIRMEDGTTIVVPTDAVRTVRLSGVGAQTPKPPEPTRPERTPDGLTIAEPRTLAGPEVNAPRRSEQLAVFGKPSEFQRDIVENRWTPETDWNMDPTTQNNFAPSTWAKGPIDPTWKPQDAFAGGGDVLDGGRSTWQQGPVDTSWQPQDGFAR